MELLAPEKRRAVRMIRDELCCKLCGRVFEDPHCLDCKHNFCRECIFLYLRKSDSSCPKCKLPTRPSEITKNQFLQSILSAWKAVEQSLAPLEDPESAALLEKQEREQDEAEKARKKQALSSSGASRGPVGNTKWNINTRELKQEADAAERRANAIEMFGGSLVQRAALKNAALDAKNNVAAEALAGVPAATPKPTTTPPVARTIKLNGFGAAHLRKMANSQAASMTLAGFSQSMNGSGTQDDASQTQMPNSAVESAMLSPLGRSGRQRSPFARSEAPSPSPNGASLSSMSSPFSVMGTQDVQGYMKKIGEHNHFLDEWAKKATSNGSLTQVPRPSFGADPKKAPKTENRTVPTISAVQRVQQLMASSTSSRPITRTPGKRKRQIFRLTADDSDPEQEYEDDGGLSQTQMAGTMADSPDLLGFGGVAPPVAAQPAQRRQSLPVSLGSAALPASRLSGAEHDSDDEVVEEKGPVWMGRKSIKAKSAPSSPQRISRAKLVVESSQQQPEVVDMTQIDDDDEDDEDEVEDSQVPGTLTLHAAKKTRVSEDFQAAISAFHENTGDQSAARLHRLSGAEAVEIDSPSSDLSPAAVSVEAPERSTSNTASPATLGSRTRLVGPTQTPASSRPPLGAAKSAGVATTSRGKGRNTSPPSASHVFVGTDLTRDEIKSVLSACHRLGGRFGRDFDVKRDATGALTSSVTHLITKSVPAEHGQENLGLRCKRTAKYLRALAEGTYVVDYSWVEASLAHGKWLPEDKYELSGDIYSDAVGKPRESRLMRLRTGNRNDIFRSFQFVLLCPEKEFDFNMQVLRAMVVHFGANVEKANTGNRMHALPETPRGKTNLGIVSKTMPPVDARRMWDIYQIPIVRVTWIFDSISHLEVLPFDEYYPY